MQYYVLAESGVAFRRVWYRIFRIHPRAPITLLGKRYRWIHRRHPKASGKFWNSMAGATGEPLEDLSIRA